MTADQTPPTVVPWRVKLKTRGNVWFSKGLTEAAAAELAAQIAERLVQVRDGSGLIPFPTRYGVTAYVRAREVWSVEPVGPRWDGVADGGRHAGVPADPADDVPAGPPAEDRQVTAHGAAAQRPAATDGTAWLARQRLDARGGVR